MKKLLGGLLLVGVISSWGLQAAQPEKKITVFMIRVGKTAKAQLGVYTESQLNNFVTLRHVQEDLGQTVNEIFIPQEYFPENVQKAGYLFSVLVKMADIKLPDAERQLPSSMKDDLQDILMLLKLANFLDPRETIKPNAPSKTINTLARAVLRFVYLQTKQEQLNFLINTVMPVVGTDSRTLLMHALFEHVKSLCEHNQRINNAVLFASLDLIVTQSPIRAFVVENQELITLDLTDDLLQHKVNEFVETSLYFNNRFNVFGHILQVTPSLPTIKKEVTQEMLQALFEAEVELGNWQVVKFLLQSPDSRARALDLNKLFMQANKSETVLHKIVQEKDVNKVPLALKLEIINLLAARGANLNIQCGHGFGQNNSTLGTTALMFAAQLESNSAQVVDVLLEAGAYPNRKDAQGLTASHYAYLHMDEHVINQLPPAALDTQRQRDYLAGLLDYYGNRSNPEKVQKFLELFRTSPVRINLTQYSSSFLDRYITSYIRIANKEVLALLLAYAQPDEIADIALGSLVDQILTKLEGEQQQEFLAVVMPYVPRVIIDNAQSIYTMRGDTRSLETLNNAYAEYLRDQLIEAIRADVLDLNNIQNLLDKGADIYAPNRVGRSAFDEAGEKNNAALDYVLEPYVTE